MQYGCNVFSFTYLIAGPGVNRHKLYLKQFQSGGATPSPTQNLNYPQFSDIPNHERRGDEIHRQSAKVDVHRETDVASASYPHPPS